MDIVLQLYEELQTYLGAGDMCKNLQTKILKTMQDTIDAIPPKARIGIRCAGSHTQELFHYLNFNGKTVVGIFDRVHSEGDFCGFPCFSDTELPQASCDYLIISNFFDLKTIRTSLQGLPERCKVINFYGILEEQGLKLHAPFYFYLLESPAVLNYFYRKYMKNQKSEKDLHELLAASVEHKDFAMISKLYDLNGGANGENQLLHETWERTNKLLKVIHEKLQERTQRDVVLFWTDAVPYSDLDYMPKISKLKDSSCFFSRAYTHTPYTQATLQAMFRSILPIDDYPETEQGISRDNSLLIQYLDSLGYEFRWLGDLTLGVSDEFTLNVGDYSSVSVVWWQALLHILQSQKPCFYILQAVTESHDPIISPDLEVIEHTSNLVWSQQINEQKRISLAYLDSCLDIYRRLLGNRIQIFLSDHGHFWQGRHMWSSSTLHTYCLAMGEGIPRKKITKFFPYKNFMHFVQWIIEPEHYDLEPALENEVVFRDTDYYDPIAINNYLNRGDAKSAIAFRGVVTYDHKYAINALGEEFFYSVDEEGNETPAALEDESLRAELRKKCGTCFLDIRKLKKFQYTKKLYEAIRQVELDSRRPLWLEDGEAF